VCRPPPSCPPPSRSNLDFDQHKSDCFGTFGINFASSSCDPPAQENGVFTSASGDFRLEWIPTPSDPDNSLTFTIQAQTTGWASVGFSTQPIAHSNVDVISGFIDTTGTVTLQDGFLNSYSYPAMDASNDINAISGDETASTTTLTFSRLLNTGDPQDQDLSG
jgi:hypothetical protein